MKKEQIFLFIIVFHFLFMQHSYAKSPTLYVVTRSTTKFKIGQQENPTVGLFSTTNKGKNWRHYGWSSTKFFSVAAKKYKGKHVFFLACGNGIQRSEDNGKTWKIATGCDITECLKAAIDPVMPQIVYTATAYGIFKTTNHGETWTEMNKGLISTFTPTIIIDNKNHNELFCATEAGIHFSRNGGEDWKPLALLGLGIRTLIQHPQNGNLLAAGTEDNGVFISTDRGKTWQERNSGLTHKTVYALAFDPQDINRIYAGTFRGGIFKSTDKGNSWTAINNNLRILDIHALIVDPGHSNIIYAGTLNDGVWLSEDAGESWCFIGLETSQVWDMMFF